MLYMFASRSPLIAKTRAVLQYIGAPVLYTHRYSYKSCAPPLQSFAASSLISKLVFSFFFFLSIVNTPPILYLVSLLLASLQLVCYCCFVDSFLFFLSSIFHCLFEEVKENHQAGGSVYKPPLENEKNIIDIRIKYNSSR